MISGGFRTGDPLVVVSSVPQAANRLLGQRVSENLLEQVQSLLEKMTQRKVSGTSRVETQWSRGPTSSFSLTDKSHNYYGAEGLCRFEQNARHFEGFAARTGARILAPRRDMKRREEVMSAGTKYKSFSLENSKHSLSKQP